LRKKNSKKFKNKNATGILTQKSDLCSDQGCQKRQMTTVFKTFEKLSKINIFNFWKKSVCSQYIKLDVGNIGYSKKFF
jgi:hypothetical protein